MIIPRDLAFETESGHGDRADHQDGSLLPAAAFSKLEFGQERRVGEADRARVPLPPAGFESATARRVAGDGPG